MSGSLHLDYGLLVKDIVIRTTAYHGADDWWLMFRAHYEPSGRITTIPGTATPQGDHAWVRCEYDANSKAHAEWLRDHMIDQGVPRTAVLVRRTPKGVRP